MLITWELNRVLLYLNPEGIERCPHNSRGTFQKASVTKSHGTTWRPCLGIPWDRRQAERIPGDLPDAVLISWEPHILPPRSQSRGMKSTRAASPLGSECLPSPVRTLAGLAKGCFGEGWSRSLWNSALDPQREREGSCHKFCF